MFNLEKSAAALFARAGITVNGSAPTDVQVFDGSVYGRILRGGRLAAGETFMEGLWDVDDLTGMITLLFTSGTISSLNDGVRWIGAILQSLTSYKQSRTRGRQVAIHHYDLDGRLFDTMLDKGFASYTCGLYRDGANTLEQAQEAKLRLTCEKLHLRPGQAVLDVGSGFTAGFLRYAIEHYDVRGVGVVNSEEQAKKSRECVRGLPIEIRLQDYRDIEGIFDRVVSMGMFEHVGPGNYRTYFKKLRGLMKESGLALVHTIGTRVAQYRCDPWFDKYIFPNGVAPSLKQIAAAFDGIFVCEDIDNFGADYDQTLQAWYRNLDEGWDSLKALYGTRSDLVFRMMKYYLLSVAGGFRSRHMQLHQVVLSPKGIAGGYRPVR